MINLNNDKGNFDIGLIIIRKFNRNKQLILNEYLSKLNKPYISLVYEDLSFVIGPYTIPRVTSCLECKIIRETDNNYYGDILKLFNNSDIDSREFVLDELLELGFSYVNTIIFKRILQSNDVIIENEIAQKIMEYSFMNSSWREHNLLKSTKCKNCFPDSEYDNSVFEVKL
ncbi:hypothetical protein [Staphylococcus lutrae]|uniref:Uncharacterized protein n=1 Tax=Staphylococcus lutrae TaxID=155085 RepID=A0AAC9RV15_9STAP|nr:hypothetical protein [Staphylococcus lutrae]ARJ51430.1 hypothetical protein B5P37_08950 [Staphylococcus lutrae]PNZ34648.1 hypothetical protein CD134_10455 [Staphylococcus lutrae]